MKKSYLVLIIFLILLSAACNVHAQYATQGTVEFGGAVSYSSTTLVSNGTKADESTSIFQFMPYAGYFVANGLTLAISPGINILTPAGSSNSITNYLLFFAPGYTFSLRGNVYPYIQGMVGYSGLTIKSSDVQGITIPEQKLGGLSYGGKAGLKVLVGKSGLLSVGVSYIALNFSQKGADKRSGMDNLAFSLGWSVFISK